MNVRRTSLIIVLALALAACAAPIQAPPIRPQQPSAQEALPFVTEREQGQLPAVTAPEVTLPDVFVPEIPAPEIAPPLPLPAGQRVPTVDELTLGVPQQIHEDIARYVEQLQAPAVAPVLKLEEVTRGVPQQIHEDIARAIENMQAPASAPAVTTKPELPGMDDLASVFPWVQVEQPKAATHSMDAWAGVVPPEVRADIARYTKEQSLNLEELTRGVPQQIHEDIARFVGAKQFIAEVNQATLPTAIQRDQWWVDETTPQTPPVTYVDTVRYMMEQATAQEPAFERGEAYVDTVRYVMLNH